MAEALYDESGAQIRSVRTPGTDKLAIDADEILGPDAEDLTSVKAAILDTRDTWIVSHQEVDNGAAYQTRAAVAGQSHYIVAAGLSFNDAALDGKQGGLDDADAHLLKHYVKGE